jgi:predicted nucleic acid-binding protein
LTLNVYSIIWRIWRRFVWRLTSIETALQGLIIHHNYQVSFYDAVLISSALFSNCRLFLTEDFTHGQTFDSLRIVNPFVTVPSELL